MNNLAVSNRVLENFQNNVIKIEDWIKGKEEAVKKAGAIFQDNPDGTWKWSGFGNTALTFAYYPIQWHKRIVILSGSIRSGKTTVMIEKWLTYCTQNPYGLKAIIGVSKDTIYQNVLSDLFNYLDTIGTEYKYNQSNGYLKVKYGEGRKDWFVCKVIGSKDKGSIKYLRGVTLSGAYVDELTLIDNRFFKELLGRCSVENSKIFATTNPDTPNHWAYTQFVKDGVNPDVEVWTFLLNDNPTLSKEYIEFITRQYSGAFSFRFILGQWVVAEGLVFEEFKQEKHIFSEIQASNYKEFIAGVDFGYSAPMAAGVWGVTRDNKFDLLYEFYEKKKLTKDVSLWLQDKQAKLGRKLNYIFCDSAEPDRVVELTNDGLNAYLAEKEILSGLNTVKTLFANNRARVHKDCENTQNELLTLRWAEEGEPGYGDEKKFIGDDHASDMTRYTLHSYCKLIIGL